MNSKSGQNCCNGANFHHLVNQPELHFLGREEDINTRAIGSRGTRCTDLELVKNLDDESTSIGTATTELSSGVEEHGALAIELETTELVL